MNKYILLSLMTLMSYSCFAGTCYEPCEDIGDDLHAQTGQSYDGGDWDW